MTQDQIIGLSLLIIGLLTMFCFGYFTWCIKHRDKLHDAFYQRNKESQTIWEFTKKNFPIFITLFGFIIAFSGLMMLV